MIAAYSFKEGLSLVSQPAARDGVAYNGACAAARASLSEEGEAKKAYITQAFEMLIIAIDCGWEDGSKLKKDPDLKPLRDDPRWAEILKLFGGE